MPNVQEYAAKFTGDTKDFEAAADRVVQKSTGLTQTLGAGLVLGAGAAAGMAAFDALAGGIGAATSSAMDFEKTMSGVKAVSGASQSQLADLSQLALKLGADTSFSASESAKGLEELVKAGVSVGDIMGGAAKASLDLAAAGGTDVASAAEIAANAMNAFSIKGADMAHVADLIAGAANASAIDVNDFKFSLASAGAVASTIGFSFDDLAQGIAVMGQAGIKGSDAGTSLKTMMMNLQPVTDKQVSLFKQLGIVTADGANQFFDATGSVKSMADVAQVLQNALGGMTKQQQLATLEVMFGSDAIRAGAVLTKAGAAGFNQMADAMGNVSAASVADTRLDNLAGSIEKFKGSAETASITMGTAFTPALKAMVDAATANVNASLPGLQSFAEQLAGMAQRVTPGLITIATTIQKGVGASVQFLALQVLPRAIDAAEGLFGYLSGTALPILTSLGQYFKAVAEDGDYLNDFLVDLPEPMQGVVQNAGQMVAAFRDGIPAMVGAMQQGVGFITGTLIPTVGDLLGQLGPRAVGVFNWITSTGIPALIGVAGTLASTLTGTVLPTIMNVVDWVGVRAAQAFGFITGTAIPTALGMFGQLAGFLTSTVLPTVENLIQTVGPRLGQAINFIATTAFPGMLGIASQVAAVFNSTILPAFDALAGWAQTRIPAAFGFLTQSAVPAFLKGFQTVAGFITGSLGPALGDLADWAGPKLAAGFLFFTNTMVPTVMTALGGLVGFLRGTVAPALLSFGEQIFPAIGSEIDHFSQDVLPQIVSAGSTVVGWITGTAIPALTNFGQWLGPLLATSIDWLTGTAFPAIVSVGGTVADWVTGTAVPALQMFGTWLQPNLEGAWSWLTGTALPAIVSAGQTVADWVTGTAIPALTAFGQWLQPNLEAAWSWLTSTAFPAIAAAGDAVMSEFNDHLVPAFQTVVSWLQEKLPPALAWLTDSGIPDLVRQAQSLAGTINNYVIYAWNTLTQKFSELGVFEKLNKMWTDLKDIGNLLAGALGTINTNGEPTSKIIGDIGPAAEVAARAVKIFLEPLERTITAFKWMLENGDAIKGFFGGITGGVNAAAQTIHGAISGKPNTDDPREYLRLAAGAKGIDPEQALAVMSKEGADWGTVGQFPTGTSYGPLQLHYAGGPDPRVGMGDAFTAATGIDLRTDKSMEAAKAAIDYALDQVLKDGTWKQWYGANNAFPSLPNGLPGRYTAVNRVDPQEFINQMRSQFAGATAAGGGLNMMAPTASQFSLQGDGLSYSEAAAFCGPYAAELMMNALGRPITTQEAKDAASAVGWTPGLGMRGIGSEEQLIDNLLQSQGMTGLDAYQMAGTTENARTGLQSGPIGISTAGHYFYGTDINDQGQINVGATGTVFKGGSEWMTLDQMSALAGPMQGIIALQGQMGTGFNQLTSTIDTSTGLWIGSIAAAGASITQGMNLSAEATLAAGGAFQNLETNSQALTDFIGNGVATAASAGATAMQLFGERMAPVSAQVAASGLDFGTLADSIIQTASSSGLAVQPFADLNMGLIDQETALQQVLAAAAAVDPQYAALSQAVSDGSISVQDAAVQFANMTAQTAALASAVAPATTALQTMGGYAPTLIAEFGSGAISAETLGERIVGMASAAGLATGTLGDTTAGTGEFNAQLLAVIKSAAEADPQFAELSQKIFDEGTITADTVLQFLDLLSRYQAVPAAASTAQTATEQLTGSTDALGSQTSETAGVVTEKHDEIAKSATTMEGTVTGATTTMANTTAANATTMTDKMLAAIQKINADMNTNMEKLIGIVDRGVSEIVGALNEISQTKVTVDTKSASKSIDELSNDARAAIGWLNKLESETGQKVRFSGGPSGKAAGGWVQHAASGLNPVMTGELGRELAWLPNNTMVTPHWKTALIEDNLAYGRGGGGGGDTITLNFSGDIYGVDDLEDRVLTMLRGYKRRGGDI